MCGYMCVCLCGLIIELVQPEGTGSGTPGKCVSPLGGAEAGQRAAELQQAHRLTCPGCFGSLESFG